MAKLPDKPSKLMMKGFLKVEGRQNIESLVSYDYDADGYSACALGCTYIGLGIYPEAIDEESVDLEALNQQLFDGWKAYHPEQPNLKLPIADVITSLNDSYSWPIWKISNWLSESLGL